MTPDYSRIESQIAAQIGGLFTNMVLRPAPERWTGNVVFDFEVTGRTTLYEFAGQLTLFFPDDKATALDLAQSTRTQIESMLPSQSRHFCILSAQLQTRGNLVDEETGNHEAVVCTYAVTFTEDW